MRLRIQDDPTQQSTRGRIQTGRRLVAIALRLSFARLNFARLSFAGLMIVASGCLGGGDQASQAQPETLNAADIAADRATQIEVLSASIERDHRTLEDLITQPGLAADESLHDNPELRAIAERLTGQERALEELEASLSASPSGPAE